MAPELWDGVGGRHDASHLAHAYTSAVDMWALGVTLHMLLTGQRPWFHSDINERARMICEEPLHFPERQWRHISTEAQALVSQLLEKDPSKRISAKDAMAHPWIVRRRRPCQPPLRLHPHHLHPRLRRCTSLRCTR